MEASGTPLLKSGNFGPFIGAVFDIARILDSFRTAQYQYIPALASARGRQLILTLNAPPSFHDPNRCWWWGCRPSKLRSSRRCIQSIPRRCIARKRTPDPAGRGARWCSPRLRAWRNAEIPARDGTPVDLPARAEAERGGFAVDTSALRNMSLGDTTRASLRGYWGFDKYEGPSFQLVDAREQTWKLAAGTKRH